MNVSFFSLCVSSPEAFAGGGVLEYWRNRPARIAAAKNARMMVVFFIAYTSGKNGFLGKQVGWLHSTTMNVSTLSTLSLPELKQLAKGRRIKQYYIMKRLQLIQILSLNELPESFRLEKLTIVELRDEARRKGVKGFWSLHRDDLLEVLYPSADREDAKSQTSDISV
jgi:hypothetical protein